MILYHGSNQVITKVDLSRLTTYIANKLHLSTMAAVGAVCMSKVANELAGGKIPVATTFEELSERLLKEVTMAR